EARKIAEEYQKQALASGYQKSEWQAARDADVEWAVADGPIWFASAIRNDEPGREQLCPNPSGDQKRHRKAEVDRLLDTLRGVYREAGGNEPSSPVPYYAALLMDGDSMGELVGKLGSPQKLSECLGAFAG